MFDSMIDEADRRFELGDRAGTLLSALLALITNTRGGLDGFLDRFRNTGLGDLAASWVNTGANTPLANEQLESALGEDTINDLSARVGTNYDKTRSAAAFMIPHIVDQLTPDGVVPQGDDLLSRIGAYLNGDETEKPLTPAETFDRIGTAAVAEEPVRSSVAEKFSVTDDAGALGDRADTRVEAIDEYETNDNSVFRWLLPLILLFLILLLGYMFCSQPAEAPTTPAANTNTANG